MKLSQTLQTCLGLRRGETVLLLTDEGMKEVSRLLQEALSELTDELLFLSMKPRSRHGEEPPPGVASAMLACDVVVAATSKSITHTEATRRAVRRGCRIASMPGITVEMLEEGGMTADYRVVAREARRVAEAFTMGSLVEIESPGGTRFRASIAGRQGYADTGLLRGKGDFGNLPGGEGFIAPVEGSAEGRLVFDGPFMGGSSEPVVVEVEAGRAVRTSSGSLERVFAEIEGAEMVGEVGVGVNPCARLTGNILEDEKALGTAHVAFGNNAGFGGKISVDLHLDGLIKSPVVRVDGKRLPLPERRF